MNNQQYTKALKTLAEENPHLRFSGEEEQKEIDCKTALGKAGEGTVIAIMVDRSSLVVFEIDPNRHGEQAQRCADLAEQAHEAAEQLTNDIEANPTVGVMQSVGGAVERSMSRARDAAKTGLAQMTGGPVEANAQLEALAKRVGTPLATTKGEKNATLQIWYRTHIPRPSVKVDGSEAVAVNDAKLWRVDTLKHLTDKLRSDEEFGQAQWEEQEADLPYEHE